MLRIKREVLIKIIAYAKKVAPIEACGYLAGKEGFISEHYELTNADASAEHYSFKPEEQFAVMRDARKKNLELLAAYHSHPASPARMSGEDIHLAYDPQISYVIISLKDIVTVKSFKVIDGQVVEEELEIIE